MLSKFESFIWRLNLPTGVLFHPNDNLNLSHYDYNKYVIHEFVPGFSQLKNLYYLILSEVTL